MIAVLADPGLPPFGGSQLFSTQFEFVPVAMIVVALGLYLWGVRRNNALHPRHRWPVGKTIAWVGALFTTGIAIFSFIGVYDGELFWDHMVQHLLLIMVAAPLFAISSPIDLAWRASKVREQLHDDGPEVHFNQTLNLWRCDHEIKVAPRPSSAVNRTEAESEVAAK